jgi:hypothetical protein
LPVRGAGKGGVAHTHTLPRTLPVARARAAAIAPCSAGTHSTHSTHASLAVAMLACGSEAAACVAGVARRCLVQHAGEGGWVSGVSDGRNGHGAWTASRW